MFDCDDNEESESDAEEIVDDESDADIEENFEGKCGACMGTDGLDEANNWIGCNSCPRWFHKSCLSGGVEEMDEEEILRFHFKCPICEKSETSIKRRSHLNSKYTDLYVYMATHIGIIDVCLIIHQIIQIFVFNGFLFFLKFVLVCIHQILIFIK